MCCFITSKKKSNKKHNLQHKSHHQTSASDSPGSPVAWMEENHQALVFLGEPVTQTPYPLNF